MTNKILNEAFLEYFEKRAEYAKKHQKTLHKKCPDCGKDIKEVIKGLKYYCEHCGYYFHDGGPFAFTVGRGMRMDIK